MLLAGYRSLLQSRSSRLCWKRRSHSTSASASCVTVQHEHLDEPQGLVASVSPGFAEVIKAWIGGVSREVESYRLGSVRETQSARS